MQGKMGRVAGQFGVWPTWYIDYIRSLGRGSAKNAAKRIAIFTGMGYGVKEIGESVFGVDVKKWVWYHPMLWTGGPMISALGAVKDIATGGDYEKATGVNTLKQLGKLYIPFYLAAHGLLSAHEESREEDQWKVGLGFRPSE